MFDQQRLRGFYGEHKVWELYKVPYDRFMVDFMRLSGNPEIRLKHNFDDLVLKVLEAYKTEKLPK